MPHNTDLNREIPLHTILIVKTMQQKRATKKPEIRPTIAVTLLLIANNLIRATTSTVARSNSKEQLLSFTGCRNGGGGLHNVELNGRFYFECFKSRAHS